MVKKFGNVTRIVTRELFDLVSAYSDALIDEATANGSLDDPGADNDYTREIGRTIRLCAAYEIDFMTFKHIRPLRPVVSHNEFLREVVPIEPIYELTAVAV
jgi:hypothetical protein